METTAESDYDIDDLRTRVLDYLRSEPQSQRLDDSPRLSLSDHEESVLRDVLSGHEAMRHLGYTNGRLHTAIVRALMRVRDPMHFAIEENGAPATAKRSL